ncbi:MAG: CoA pyrophosphatase [Nitrospirae bacterium]|nr:CoA pyrophosphatase [Candidatus Manganitrophaceae bacterium]
MKGEGPRRTPALEQFWDVLTRSVEARKGLVLQKPTLRPAAVLIPFFEKEGAPFLLLTKRSGGVQRHPGEIAFPGGCLEPADADLFETALREGREEIGLEPKAVRLIGRLDDHETVSGFSVTPFVARISYPYSFRLDLREVTALIEVPFYFLTDPGQGRERTILFRGNNRTVRSYLYNGNDIWGATAEIIHGLVSRFRVTAQWSGRR